MGGTIGPETDRLRCRSMTSVSIHNNWVDLCLYVTVMMPVVTICILTHKSKSIKLILSLKQKELPYLKYIFDKNNHV